MSARILARRLTRAEFTASNANWKPGEIGFISDEGTILVATLDAAKGSNVFYEHEVYSTFPMSNTAGPSTYGSAWNTAVELYGAYDANGDQLNRFAVETCGYFIPQAALAVELSFAGNFGAPPVQAMTLYEWPQLVTLDSSRGGNGCGFGQVIIRNCPKLTTILLTHNGFGSGYDLTGTGITYFNDQGALPLVSIDVNGCPDFTGVAWGTGNTFPSLTTIDVSSTSFSLASATAMEAILPSVAGTLTIDDTPAVADGGWAALKATIEAKGWTVTDGL